MDTFTQKINRKRKSTEGNPSLRADNCTLSLFQKPREDHVKHKDSSTVHPRYECQLTRQIGASLEQLSKLLFKGSHNFGALYTQFHSSVTLLCRCPLLIQPGHDIKIHYYFSWSVLFWTHVCIKLHIISGIL